MTVRAKRCIVCRLRLDMRVRTLQERRVKEKDKRMRGQSSVNHWKSEAEMVLRQQYDS